MFLRWNSIYSTEQSINSIFRRLDHDDDKSLSYSEFREALNSHLSYPYNYSSLVRETVIRGSPYWTTGLRSSVYQSPYRATATFAQDVYWPAYWSPYWPYYPEYVSPSWYWAPLSYESPMKYHSPQRSHFVKNLDMPYS